MNLLDANDRAGEYPDSWYAATAPLAPPRAPLKGDIHTDVCVVGAGYTGLSAALHLAEAGLSVVVVDAQRVGFGASGRNGGQLGAGQRKEQPELEAKFGKDTARHLWDLGLEATALVKSLVEKHNIDCYLRPGLAWTASTASDVADLHRYAEHMDHHYGYELTPLDAQECHALCPSPDYKGGVLDWAAGHLHPLRYALGLARAAEDTGAVIYEKTRVLHINPDATAASVRVVTDQGNVTSQTCILACNGYLGDLSPPVAAKVMPINNFIAATEPLGARTAEVLTRDIAVSDARFVINYFRLSHDGRLLFGGGESYGYRFPSDIRATVAKPMLEIFPNLKDIRLEYAWGGTLAITLSRLPYMARPAPGVFSASGYSGHGVGTATHAGKLMAQAICGQSSGFDIFSNIPANRFPGGTRLRSPLLAMAMTWFALRDRLGL